MNATVRRVATPAIVGAGLAAVLGGGIATAHYRSGVAASGAGAATPVAAGPLTLAATGAVGSGLYPGGPGADVTVTVVNPYARPVTVESLAAAGAVGVTPVAGRTCAAHGLTLDTTPGGLPAVIPASSTGTITLTGVATLGATADNGCQGATFTIPFQVSGRL